jgi:hypothetical protein
MVLRLVCGIFSIRSDPIRSPKGKEGQGDGSFSISEDQRRLYFVLRQKNPVVLHYIHSYFQFGSVFLSEDGYWSYSVSGRDDILELIKIFNGRLVLEKTNKRFIPWLPFFHPPADRNEKSITPGLTRQPPNRSTPFLSILIRQRMKEGNRKRIGSVSYKGRGTFMGLNNAWLCGFTDSDGSFGFTINADKSRTHGCRTIVYWYIDQFYARIDLEMIRDALKIGYIEKKIPGAKGFKPSQPDLEKEFPFPFPFPEGNREQGRSLLLGLSFKDLEKEFPSHSFRLRRIRIAGKKPPFMSAKDCAKLVQYFSLSLSFSRREQGTGKGIPPHFCL